MNISEPRNFKNLSKHHREKSSNLSLIKGTFKGLKHLYPGILSEVGHDQELKKAMKRSPGNKNTNPSDGGENMITMIKRTGLENSELQRLNFKTIDEALHSLRGDVWISELLLVITPEKDTVDSSNLFEIHGIDKIYRQFLGTIYVSREELRAFEESRKFDNYSMMFVNSPVDPKTCLEFLVGQCEDPDEFVSPSTQRQSPPRRKKANQCGLLDKDSEPTFHELLRRLEGSAQKSKSSDLTKFFDFAEKYNFSITVRPDFVKFSNKLIVDFFIFENHYVGALALTNKEIEEQLELHKKLLEKLVMVEDTNELIIPKPVAGFIRRLASLLRLLYVYDYLSDFIYKVYHNI